MQRFHWIGTKLSRRQFLKLVGVAGALTLPAALGYQWLTHSAEPSVRSPYAVESTLPSTAPLLVVFNEQTDNPFAPYLGEILRAEGLGMFQVAWLSQLDASTLARFALVILSEGRLTAAQVEMLTAYVAQGGKLIAMRPAANLTELFGATSIAGATENTYIRTNTRHSQSDLMLQFHGAATHYRVVTNAQVIAWLTDEQGVPSTYPAITLHRWGKGQTALWAFDLARSIVYTRQGNPAWANQERDGRPGIRAVDAFVGWMDLDRLEIPHADEHMRLFSHLIGRMLDDTIPLPRLWYLPGGADGLLIATGDAHQAPVEVTEQVLRRVERYNGRMSVYYTPTAWGTWRRIAFRLGGESGLSWLGERSTDPLPSQVQDWRARGHEFGIHPYVEEGVELGYRRAWQDFIAHGYAPVPPTVRTHRILWSGWVETARIQASLGLRMNVDYYHYGTAFQRAPNEWVYGYLNGSGLPMKFVDEQGRILDIYQQVTHLVDEHLMKMPWGGGWANLNGDDAVAVARALLERSLGGVPAAIGAQFHIDPFAAGGEFAANATRWLDGTLDYAVSRGIPIWSAERWLHFTEIRATAQFNNLVWDADRGELSCQLDAPVAADMELTLLLPSAFRGRRLAQILVDGSPVTAHAKKIGGEEFQAATMSSGAHKIQARFQND